VDDVAAAHVAAAERPRVAGEFMLGGENAPQIRMFEITRDLTGRGLPRRIPFALAHVVGALDELRSAVFRRPPLLTRSIVDIFGHDWQMDSARSIAELDYRITPLSDGMKRLLRHGQPSCNPPR
jgi:nucleoside-diphosphate-sugar epimerase